MVENIRLSVGDIVGHFEELEDPRSPINLQHPLVSVVVIALMAGPAGRRPSPSGRC